MTTPTTQPGAESAGREMSDAPAFSPLRIFALETMEKLRSRATEELEGLDFTTQEYIAVMRVLSEAVIDAVEAGAGFVAPEEGEQP